MLGRISLKFKLVLAFLLVGILPLLISATMNYWQAFNAINELALKTAKSVAKDKEHAIVNYFENEALSLADFADNEMTINALEELSIPFEKDTINPDWLSQNKSIVLKYYKEQFGKVYSEQTKKNFNVDKISSQLDGLTVAAQLDFIVNNDNPIGKKDLLISPKRPSQYGNAHTRFHPFFHKYIQRHALYDLFLVNSSGRIVYTVFKETDFATSLKTGPWANTGLAKAFEASKKLQQNEVHIEDFSSYTPSYEAPASFAATPIFKNGKYIGSLMVQLPLDKISKIAGNREGMGEKGETLLLGSDLKLRADTFRNKETHTVAAAFSDNSNISVDSEAVRLAKTGAEGSIKNTSYDGLKTLAYYMPIKIKNLTWFVITELSADETFSVLDSIIKYTVGLIGAGLILITLFSSYIGQSLSKSISTIAVQLSSSAEQVAAASNQIAYSSQGLSKSTTEQASSLEETAASLEEITSMISKASDNAEIASQTSSVSHQKAEEGRNAVDQMLVSMDEISQSNDAILNQINESNQHMTEVVKVIQDIGARTKVINEIVFQTKLLSFNASVEAARAGEHGKGFAIVAEEVGNLAQMSGNAAKEITDILDASISKVEGIVQETQQKVEVLIQTGKEKVNTGVTVAQECSNVLNEIVQNVARISNLSQEISLASKEQSQGVAEINKAMSQLDTVTQQNASASEEASKSAIELSSQAQMLKASVDELLSVVNGKKMNPNIEDSSNINNSIVKQNESKVVEIKFKKNSQPSYSQQATADFTVPDHDDEGFKEV